MSNDTGRPPTDFLADAEEDDSFAEALAGLEAVQASPDTEALVEQVVRHGREEGVLLAEYASLVDRAPSPAVRYLMELILADERRHHRNLVEMASAMAWGEMPGTPAGATPALDGGLEPDDEIAAATRRLLAHERHDHAELLRLRRRLRPYSDTTLWSLLVDLMIADTEKHQRILGFVLDHLASRR